MKVAQLRFQKVKILFLLLINLLLVLTIVFSGCQNGDSSENTDENGIKSEATIKALVTGSVINQSKLEYIGSKIGGNELVSSVATVSNVKFDYGETTYGVYNVSGRMVMKDKYGTSWSNNFDVNVICHYLLDYKCTVQDFTYTSKSWSRS